MFRIIFTLFLVYKPAYSLSLSQLDEYYSSLTKMNQFSGAVLYYSSGQREFFKFYGSNYSKNKSPTFRIGSLSKPITATAILSLVERKKINLDLPINKVLKNLNIPDFVTVKNLLNHTSGAIYEFSRDIKTESDFRNAVQNTSWNTPGKWVYSNVGYQLLGLVVKEVANQPLYLYVQKEIFPKIIPPSETNLVQGISNDCGKILILKEEPYYDVGSGGIIATSEAVSEFFVALNDNKILSQATKMIMKDDSEKIGYGLGLYVKNVDGKLIYSHNGSVPGFKSFVMFNEKNEFLFVFNSIEQFPLVQAQKDSTLFLLGKEVQIPTPISRKAKSIDTKSLMDFVGEYVLDFDVNQNLKISYNSRSKHFYILDEGKNKKLYPESTNSFYTCPTSPDTVYFKREGKKVYLELTSYGGAKFKASRKN